MKIKTNNANAVVSALMRALHANAPGAIVLAITHNLSGEPTLIGQSKDNSRLIRCTFNRATESVIVETFASDQI